MTMIEAMNADAERCNERMRLNMGVGSHTVQKPSKPKRVVSPDATQRILATVSDTPMTTAQLAEQTGASIETVRRACRRLSRAGKIQRCDDLGNRKTYRRAE